MKGSGDCVPKISVKLRSMLMHLQLLACQRTKGEGREEMECRLQTSGEQPVEIKDTSAGG